MEKTLPKALRSVIFTYRARFSLAVFLVLISNFLMILNPLIFRQAVISLDPNSAQSKGMIANAIEFIFSNHIHKLSVWVLILLIIALISSFLKYRMRIEFIAISRDVERKLRFKLFTRIQSHSLAFFDRHRIGELMSRLTNDISVYREVLGPGVMYPSNFLTVLIPASIGMLSISVPLTLIALLPILILPLMMVLIGNYIYKTSMSVHKTLGIMSTMVQEDYSGIRITKSYAIENRLLDKFKQLCLYLLGLNMRLEIVQGLFFPFLTLLTRLTTLGLVMLSAFIIVKAWADLSTADFVSFMWIQSYIYFPVLMLGWVLPIYERGSSAYDRLVEIYNEPLEIQDNPTSTLEVPKQTDIQFTNLSFSYPNSTVPALSNFSLHIKAGSFVGITGAIGAGKSTLFRLLNREYEIPYGMISIGGYDIHDYKIAALRRGIVGVEQKPFLFSKSVSENIRFGAEEASQDALETVMKMADLHETVQSFPDQYNTLVGERGVTLSGGQKQRLAMARAFLVDRPILLLDDIFSAIDAETENRIFGAMQTAFAGKTVLIITHRVTILEQMDQNIYMQRGKIAEQGTHKDLLNKKGLYAALCELQSNGNQRGYEKI